MTDAQRNPETVLSVFSLSNKFASIQEYSAPFSTDYVMFRFIDELPNDSSDEFGLENYRLRGKVFL